MRVKDRLRIAWLYRLIMLKSIDLEQNLTFAEKKAMHKSLFLFAVLMLMTFGAWAQGKVTVKEDPIITQMMERYTQTNKARKTVDGWRVQIMATPDRQNLDRSLQSFQYRYPNLSADWVHNNPYYKIRVGAFSTRLEAQRLLNILKPDYPGAYLVADNQMKPAELLGTY
jgi:hypothetical protein